MLTENTLYIVYTLAWRLVDIMTGECQVKDDDNGYYIQSIFKKEENAKKRVEHIKSVWKIDAWYEDEDDIDDFDEP